MGLLDSSVDATRDLKASALEQLPHGSVAPTVGDADLKGELKKINKNMKRIIELQKQSNLIASVFYVDILALGFFYLMIISR